MTETKFTANMTEVSLKPEDTVEKGETLVFFARDWIGPGAVEYRARKRGVVVPNALKDKLPFDAYWLDGDGKRVSRKRPVVKAEDKKV